MLTKLVSFAFRSGCSYFGAKPYSAVIYGYRGLLVFLFKEKEQPRFYLFLLKNNLAHKIKIKEVNYKGRHYTAFFIPTFYKVNKKFLYNFRRFSKAHHHLISYFA